MILNIQVKKMRKKIKKLRKIILIIVFIIISAEIYFNSGEEKNKTTYEISNIPTYNGKIYIEINNNNPKFTEEDKKIEKDKYSNLENGKVRNGNGKN